MPSKTTIGKLMLTAIVITLLWNTIVAIFNTFASAIEQASTPFANLETHPLLLGILPNLKTFYGWVIFSITNATALAFIIGLAFVYEAKEMSWK